MDRVGRVCEVATAHKSGSIAVFTRTVSDAEKIAAKLIRMLDDGSERVALLTGTLRGKERAELAAGKVWRSFLPNRDRDASAPSVYLVMTSAGEVGVDLDADHGVMDLSTLDSMIQRVGRVNRMGLTEARVAIIFTEKEAERSKEAPKTHVQRLGAACAKTLEVLRELPGLSPATLRGLDKQVLEECCVPPARPARLHAEVVEAFAATSATLQLPHVSIYLHGVSDQPDPPESFLIWRWDVAHLVQLGNDAAAEAIAFFRPSADEVARVPVRVAQDLILSALERQGARGTSYDRGRTGGRCPCCPVDERGRTLFTRLRDCFSANDRRRLGILWPPLEIGEPRGFRCR